MAAKYSAAVGGIDEIAMMHLDTLAGIEKLKVCRAYKVNGEETTFFPVEADVLSGAECVYETVDGWDEDLSGMTEYDELPVNVRNYITLVEDIVKTPISIIGVGPKRRQSIFRN